MARIGGRGSGDVVTLPGAKRLDTALAKMEDDLTDENVARAAGELVMTTARQMSRSRRVRSSGRVSTRKGRGRVRAVVKFGSPRAPFTAASHFGHGTKSRPRAQGGYMPANPFLHRGRDQREDDVVDLWLRQTRDAISEAGF